MTDSPNAVTTNVRRPDIQGLRAIAVLAVVAFHAGLPLPGGFVGVDVFFVISGFVITSMLQREFSSTGTISFKAFYLRRFKRLTPALSLAVLFTLAGALLIVSPLGAQSTLAKTAMAAMFLSANIAIPRMTGGYFDTAAEHNALLHTWSLSVEEQFYLFFPVVLYLVLRFTRRHQHGARLVLFGVATLTVVSMVFAVLGSTGVVFRFSSYLVGFYSAVSRTWEFGAGALLALSRTRAPTNATLRGLLSLLGVVMLGISLWAIDATCAFPGPWTLLPVGGTLALVAVADGPMGKLLSSRALTIVGDYSYSIYLWHWPFIVFAALLWPDHSLAKTLAALASVVPAIASYRFLEEPLRHRGASGARQVGVLVATTLLAPLGLSALVMLAQRNELSWTAVVNARNAIDHPRVAGERECIRRAAFGPGDVERCSWNRGARQPPVYLVGDSNAWHFAEALIEATRRSEQPLSIVTAQACAPIPGFRIEARGRSAFFDRVPAADAFAHCPDFVTATYQWLEKASPGIVVLAAHDQYWWDDTLFVSFNDMPSTNNQIQKTDLLREGLIAATRRLRAAGHRVVLVQTIPTFRNPAPVWEPRECTLPSLLSGTCSRTVPLEQIEDVQAASRRALETVATLVPNTTVLDLRDHLCPGRVCSTHRGADWLYMDAAHLSFQGSLELEPDFAAALRRAGTSQ